MKATDLTDITTVLEKLRVMWFRLYDCEDQTGTFRKEILYWPFEENSGNIRYTTGTLKKLHTVFLDLLASTLARRMIAYGEGIDIPVDGVPDYDQVVSSLCDTLGYSEVPRPLENVRTGNDLWLTFVNGVLDKIKEYWPDYDSNYDPEFYIEVTFENPLTVSVDSPVYSPNPSHTFSGTYNLRRTCSSIGVYEYQLYSGTSSAYTGGGGTDDQGWMLSYTDDYKVALHMVLCTTGCPEARATHVLGVAYPATPSMSALETIHYGGKCNYAVSDMTLGSEPYITARMKPVSSSVTLDSCNLSSSPVRSAYAEHTSQPDGFNCSDLEKYVPYHTVDLTVSGTSGNVTWGFITWKLPDDSGVTREVCPSTGTTIHTEETSTFKTTFSNVYYFSSWARKWASQHWTVSGLTMHRGYSYYIRYEKLSSPSFSSVSTWTIGYGSHNLRVKSLSDHVTFWSTGGLWNSFTLASDLGVLVNPVNPGHPTYNDYLITADWFSQVDIDGITYKWEQANGW